MDTVTTPAMRYEVAAQREMIEMAGRVGALTAELKIIRSTLRAITTCTKEGWRADELRKLADRIDLALEPKGSPRFPEVSCSQCGQSFGPGDHGFSHCSSHVGRRPKP